MNSSQKKRSLGLGFIYSLGNLKYEKCSYLFESRLNYSHSDVCVDDLAPFCLMHLTPGIIPVEKTNTVYKE